MRLENGNRQFPLGDASFSFLLDQYNFVLYGKNPHYEDQFFFNFGPRVNKNGKYTFDE